MDFILLLAVLIVILAPLLFFGRSKFPALFKPLRRPQKRVPPQHIRPCLEKHFEYYNRLSPQYQEEFVGKLVKFMNKKEFIPRQLVEVTEEMQVLISAAAVQITFGLPDVYLKHFSRILVYPDDYYSTIFKRYHRGEVNLGGGIIVLSWKSFVRGYADGADGYNLGLHEMAHALKLENGIFNSEYDFLDEEVLKQWTMVARKTIAEIREGTESFFRSYGGTSTDEFFAVTLENFFERPLEFRTEHPKLYKITVLLLMQDPITLLSLPQ